MLKKFLDIPERNYGRCQTFIRDKRNHSIWSENVDPLKSIAIRYLERDDIGGARRIIERFSLIRNCQKSRLGPKEAAAYIQKLAIDKKQRVEFEASTEKTLQALEKQVTKPATASGAYKEEVESTGKRQNMFTYPALPAVQDSDPSPRRRAPISAGLNQSNKDPLGLGRPMQAQSLAQVAAQGGLPPTVPQVENSSFDITLQGHSDAHDIETGTPGPIRNMVSSAYGVPEIDEETKGHTLAEIRESENVGPKEKYLTELSEDEVDALHKSYTVRTGKQAREFFVLGRVFAIVWHENAGQTKAVDTDADKPFHRITIDKSGAKVFSSIRRYVIVKAKPQDHYCWAVPINTYSKFGLSKKILHEEERKAHAIIYTKGQQPRRISGEKSFTKKAIAVDPEETGDLLHRASRIHFGKLQSIEWNIRVRDCGRVTRESLHQLMLYFRDEFMREEEDRLEEDEDDVKIAEDDEDEYQE